MSQSFRSFVRRSWLVAVIVALVAGLAAGLALPERVSYQATTEVLLSADQVGPLLSNGTSVTPEEPSAAEEALTAGSGSVVEETRERLRQSGIAEPAEVEVVAGEAGGPSVIYIRATADDEAVATETARTRARVYLDRRRRSVAARLTTAADALQRRAQDLKRDARTAPNEATETALAQQYAQLLAQEARLRARARVVGPSGRVLGEPEVNRIVERAPARIGAAVALFAFVATLALLLLRETILDRVRTSDDLPSEPSPNLLATGSVRSEARQLASLLLSHARAQADDGPVRLALLGIPDGRDARTLAEACRGLDPDLQVGELAAGADSAAGVVHGDIASAELATGGLRDVPVVVVLRGGTTSRDDVTEYLRRLSAGRRAALILVSD